MTGLCMFYKSHNVCYLPFSVWFWRWMYMCIIYSCAFSVWYSYW